MKKGIQFYVVDGREIILILLYELQVMNVGGTMDSPTRLVTLIIMFKC